MAESLNFLTIFSSYVFFPGFSARSVASGRIRVNGVSFLLRHSLRTTRKCSIKVQREKKSKQLDEIAQIDDRDGDKLKITVNQDRNEAAIIIGVI